MSFLIIEPNSRREKYCKFTGMVSKLKDARASCNSYLISFESIFFNISNFQFNEERVDDSNKLFSKIVISIKLSSKVVKTK